MTGSDWPAYRGFGGGVYPVPAQTCHGCGQPYPAFHPLKLGCHDCVQAYRARGGMTAADWERKLRQGLMEQGIDPDACDCGQCQECEEARDE